MTLTHGSSPPEAVVTKPHRPQDVTSHDPSLPSSNAVEPMASTVSGTETPSSCSSIPLLASSTRCCRICRDDDPHGLYSPCRCRGSIKFVHSHCLTRWRKSLIAHGRDESANSCAMCGFSYVLKKRARLYELISYKGIRIAITVLFVLIMLFPLGYMMKMCVILSGYGDASGTAPSTYYQSLRDMSSNMDGLTVFPVCKANSNRLSFGKMKPLSSRMDKVANHDKSSTSATTSDAATMSTPSHFISLFPGPYAPHISNSNLYATHHWGENEKSPSSSSSTHRHHQQGSSQKGNGKSWMMQGSWAWLAASIDIVGSSQVASMLLYPFADDRIWHFLLCRLQHLHLGFFLLGSASNVYMACEMLSDMYDLVITPPHSRYIKHIFLVQASILVIWFWFSYNLMAFRVSTTEEEFMSELPLWALRWINVGVAIVDLSYRRVYNRLGRLKIEEELLDISEVEKVEQMQQKAWLDQQQRVLQYGQEQGQYLLDQFMALEVKQSILNGANAAVDAVSDAYAKTGIPSIASAVNKISTSVSPSSSSTAEYPESTSSPQPTA